MFYDLPARDFSHTSIVRGTPTKSAAVVVSMSSLQSSCLNDRGIPGEDIQHTRLSSPYKHGFAFM